MIYQSLSVFFTHFVVIVEPNKRLAKYDILDNYSKFGTYLRYKRIDNYDNKIKMHMRIIYFYRNYDI